MGKEFLDYPIISIAPVCPVTPSKTTTLPIDNGAGILVIALGATIVKKSSPTLKVVTVKA